MEQQELIPLSKQERALSVGRIFTPASPVSNKDLFSGRIEQLRRVMDAINQESRHVILFGERGVGKTSFTNVLSVFAALLDTNIMSIKVTCDSGDSFSSVWMKVFKQIKFQTHKETSGFLSDVEEQVYSVAEKFAPSAKLTPNDILEALTPIGVQIPLVCIIDEFDRISSAEDKRLFADTIKIFSDYSTPLTLVLVGVADSVTELISEHESIERALVQIKMPRMDTDEIKEIISNGVKKLGLKINNEVVTYAALLCKGLPHYAHLIGLHAARKSIDEDKEEIVPDYIDFAVSKGIEDVQQSITEKYRQAVASTRETIYPQVILACALAKSDEFGYFSANDICKPLSGIMGKEYSVSGFAKNLNDLCKDNRGAIIQEKGLPRRKKYRFSNPLMQPYVIMQGLANGIINKEMILTYNKS